MQNPPKSGPEWCKNREKSVKISFGGPFGAGSAKGRVRAEKVRIFMSILGENGAQKVPFWKSRKSKMAPKPTGGGKIGTGTRQKRSPGAILEKHEKAMNI